MKIHQAQAKNFCRVLDIRVAPLPDPVYEMLCEEREKQDLYRRMFKGSYNRKYDDYICVDQLGGKILLITSALSCFLDLSRWA